MLAMKLSVAAMFFACTYVLHAQASLEDLKGLVGNTHVCGAQIIQSKALHSRLRAIMGDDLQQLTLRAGMCGFAIEAKGDVLLIHNMRPHRGTEEESLIVVNEARDSLEVKLLHAGKIFTYAKPGQAFPPPPGWQDAKGWCTARQVEGRISKPPR